VLVVGGPGIVQAVGAGRATVVEEGPADAVVVGFTRDFDFAAAPSQRRSSAASPHRHER
jgi:hypothetical protein